jgi:AraC family transcriptional regulator, ethanolamine operon transcriptional activator
LSSVGNFPDKTPKERAGMPDGALLASQRSTDFDAFAAAARGWDLDFRQLDSGPFESDMVQVTTDSVNVAHATLNRLLDQRGATPVGLRTFHLVAEGSSPWVWRHHDVLQDALLIYPTGGEIHGVSRPGFEAFALAFSEDLLAGVASDMGLPDLDTMTGGSEMLRCDPSAMLGLRTWLGTLCDAIRDGAVPTADRLQYALENDLPRRLLETLRGGRVTEAYASAKVRRCAIQRAQEFIDAAQGHRVTIGDLAKAGGVSERTLQYAFLEYFGVSPNAYLREMRLNQVRSELKRSDPQITLVADVANRWGFWHMGQFAKDYRRLFAVRPSETLNT